MVVNSRFIATVSRTETVDEAKACIGRVRNEMPDASHHVYAFRVGHGNSVTEGLSDDGEPSGTAGPPVMAVLRGSDLGDTLVVVTRYFGGTKLGTGGLVRAYGDAAREALVTLPTIEKIERKLVGIETSYAYYEPLKRLIATHHGSIEDETFAGEVTLLAVFPAVDVLAFIDAFREITAGKYTPVVFEDV
jgi:uncharacterized YigZ family protein